jgi:hypothetical protein
LKVKNAFARTVADAMPRLATALRHMRVRATVTKEDQRLILFYMTQ